MTDMTQAFTKVLHLNLYTSYATSMVQLITISQEEYLQSSTLLAKILLTFFNRVYYYFYFSFISLSILLETNTLNVLNTYN